MKNTVSMPNITVTRSETSNSDAARAFAEQKADNTDVLGSRRKNEGQPIDGPARQRRLRVVLHLGHLHADDWGNGASHSRMAKIDVAIQYQTGGPLSAAISKPPLFDTDPRRRDTR